MAEPVRRDEGRRCEEAEGAGEGEPAPEEDRGRPGLGHRHVKGAEPGKLLTPDCRRRAVAALQTQFGVTERRACRVVGQPRSDPKSRKTSRLCRGKCTSGQLEEPGEDISFCECAPRPWSRRREGRFGGPFTIGDNHRFIGAIKVALGISI